MAAVGKGAGEFYLETDRLLSALQEELASVAAAGEALYDGKMYNVQEVSIYHGTSESVPKASSHVSSAKHLAKRLSVLGQVGGSTFDGHQIYDFVSAVKDETCEGQPFPQSELEGREDEAERQTVAMQYFLVLLPGLGAFFVNVIVSRCSFARPRAVRQHCNTVQGVGSLRAALGSAPTLNVNYDSKFWNLKVVDDEDLRCVAAHHLAIAEQVFGREAAAAGLEVGLQVDEHNNCEIDKTRLQVFCAEHLRRQDGKASRVVKINVELTAGQLKASKNGDYSSHYSVKANGKGRPRRADSTDPRGQGTKRAKLG